ncbi:putative phosphatidylserine decarboxylase [Biscogniauxia sp. FL1348]|nr:putative phosphatidylserine decarboxylase [Biscogniauxia sp. FL1348]
MTTKEHTYDLLVQDLRDYVYRDDDRKLMFEQAIGSAVEPKNGGAEEMAAENIKDLEEYFQFCHNLLRWVPTVSSEGDELLRKILVFYWVFDQPSLAGLQTSITPDSIQEEPKWLSYWQVIYAREIGRFMNTRESAWGIQSFYKNPIYNQESLLWQNEPAGGWASFNQFFSRQWRNIDVARPLSLHDQSNCVIVSAADSEFEDPLQLNGGFVTIKGIEWPIQKLLSDSPHTFQDGSFMHAFLSPADYHRQHAPVSGTVVEARVIQEQVYLQVTKDPDRLGLIPDRGLLFKKKPKDDKNQKKLNAPDEAGYQWLQTRGLIVIETETMGKVAVLPIGMAQVSSVVLTVEENEKIKKGQEISYFQFGGSDIVLVFEKPVSYCVKNGDKCNVRTRIATFDHA